MTVSGQGDRVEYETDTETELLETSNLLDTVSEFGFGGEVVECTFLMSRV